jgi:sigma-B regulation protein RsbU (phosphoserine phosphatase)
MSDSVGAQAGVPDEDFQDLYENAPFGYLSMLADGRICRANAALSAWTGYAPDQLVGKKLPDLLTIGTRILYETSYAPLLSMHGSFNEISFDLKTQAGEALAVTASGTVRKDAGGKTLLTRVAFFKATERRRYERGLVEAHEKSRQLEQATRALLEAEQENSELREQFIAVLGHDLRNPLASISGGLRLLQKEQAAERRTLMLQMLDGSVQRMSGLIDNVLDFARGRLGAGIPLGLRNDVKLAPVLEQIVAELRLGMPDRAIETDIDLGMPVRCDPVRIGQLVSNLLGNALTHGAPGQPVRVHADDKDGALTIWIANDGAVIAPDTMARLFQPFFRGQVRASQQGLGLGLYIASQIATAHGGELTVVSTSDETRFTFRMALGAPPSP